MSHGVLRLKLRFCSGFGVWFMALFELLSRRFALGSRLLFVFRQTGRLAISCVSVPPGRDRLCAFSGRFSVICLGWFTSGLCVYLRAIAAALAFDRRSAMRFCCGFALGSRLLFVFRQTGRLAAACVSVPPGRDRLCAFSGRSSVICLCGFTSGLDVSCRRSRRGYRGCGEREAGLAARPLCVFAQPHWYCYAFRGEYAGAARPRLRQRVFDSLDSPHAAAGSG